MYVICVIVPLGGVIAYFSYRFSASLVSDRWRQMGTQPQPARFLYCSQQQSHCHICVREYAYLHKIRINCVAERAAAEEIIKLRYKLAVGCALSTGQQLTCMGCSYVRFMIAASASAAVLRCIADSISLCLLRHINC